MIRFLFLINAIFLFEPVMGAGSQHRSIQVLSPIYKIDRKYKSMEGPQNSQQVYLLESSTPELLWLTGFRTEMVGPDGSTPTLPEFMCHVNLDYDVGKHKGAFGWQKNVSSRLFTLSQGQLSAEFPEGYGMPMMSNEPLSLATQVLNHNIEQANFEVRHKVTFDFVRDQELKSPLKPLFNTGVFGMALLEGDDGHFGITEAEETKHGPSCLPGAHAPNANGGSIYKDTLNRTFSGHWVVKSGREVNHTNVTKSMALPFDTTLHYAAVHLHPFAESLALRDVTARKTLFKSRVKNSKNKIGLDRVSSFSSKKGIPLFKNHEYELVSIYNNTTPIDQDSMAVMLLFMLDKEFKKPSESSFPAATGGESITATRQREIPRQNLRWMTKRGLGITEEVKEKRIVLRTIVGDLVLALFPDIAPKTVAHILELVKAGAYDTTHFYRVEPGFVAQTSLVYDRTQPLTPEQHALIHKLPLEPSALKHERGVLSMAREDNDPNSGESSFCIMLGNAPHLDGKYTVFGKVLSGLDGLEAIEKVNTQLHKPVQRLEITKAEIVKDPHSH